MYQFVDDRAYFAARFRLLDGVFAWNYTHVFWFAEPYVCLSLLFFAVSQLVRRRKTA